MTEHALLFDFDGLILDTETLWCRILIDALAEDGIDVCLDDIRHFIGIAGPEFEVAWRHFASRHLGPGFDRERLRERATPRLDAAVTELEILPGVSELLSAARARGWRTGLGTGSQRAIVMPRLQVRGLASAFDAIVTIDDVERGKPAPDIYLELAQRLGVSPECCVVLEDSVHGCEAAIAAGMEAIVCPCPATEASDFPPAAERVVSLADVVFEELATRASARPRR